ncbi:MAG TPA: substrate-binding domain-containing protein, partial [Nakamurella sp.]
DLQLVLLMARVGASAERTIRYLRLGYVDGVVVVSHHRSDEIERALVAASLPSVFVGRPWNMPDRFSYVDTDNERGGEIATEHLLARGRRRVGTVAGPPDMTPAQDRLAGWRFALTTRGLPVDAYEHGDFTTPGGLAATERLLDSHPDLDSIFVASDLMAVGALAVLKARGLAFGHDQARTPGRRV